ncbi:MAG: hypothetical protein SOW25_02595, partial [Helicobacter sp.]|nr:hypothetical protein [Helicobacter sp.]
MKAIFHFLFFLPFFTPLFAKSLEQGQNFSFAAAQSPLDSISIWQYLGVILILLGLLIALWYVKTKLSVPKIAQKKNFLGNILNKDSTLKESVMIESITTLNLQNKLIIFNAYNKRYIVLLGQNGATILD